MVQKEFPACQIKFNLSFEDTIHGYKEEVNV